MFPCHVSWLSCSPACLSKARVYAQECTYLYSNDYAALIHVVLIHVALIHVVLIHVSKLMDKVEAIDRIKSIGD